MTHSQYTHTHTHFIQTPKLACNHTDSDTYRQFCAVHVVQHRRQCLREDSLPCPPEGRRSQHPFAASANGQHVTKALNYLHRADWLFHYLLQSTLQIPLSPAVKETCISNYNNPAQVTDFKARVKRSQYSDLSKSIATIIFKCIILSIVLLNILCIYSSASADPMNNVHLFGHMVNRDNTHTPVSYVSLQNYVLKIFLTALKCFTLIISITISKHILNAFLISVSISIYTLVQLLRINPRGRR